jgi:hypothetical protein
LSKLSDFFSSSSITSSGAYWFPDIIYRYNDLASTALDRTCATESILGGSYLFLKGASLSLGSKMLKRFVWWDEAV